MKHLVARLAGPLAVTIMVFSASLSACNATVPLFTRDLPAVPAQPAAGSGRDATVTPIAEQAVRVVQVAAGGLHACALTDTGSVKCWGDNYFGQLGAATTADKSRPVEVSGLGSGVSALAAGHWHTCALMAQGGVKCWGSNGSGELGDGTTTTSATPVDVGGLNGRVIALAAGYWHTCALTAQGGVKCWGENHTGQLGDGTRAASSIPVDVVGLASGVKALAANYEHTCALMAGGGVKCWGWNGYGGLGDGTTQEKTAPVDVIGLDDELIAIAAGATHTCGLTVRGGVECWGENYFGELGDGTTVNTSRPVTVSGLSGAVEAIAPGGTHTCALLAGTGGVVCWGDNEFGQLGDGSRASQTTPVAVRGLSGNVTAVAAGSDYTCALTTRGGVKCWGANGSGQLGDGTTAGKNTSVAVIGLGE